MRQSRGREGDFLPLDRPEGYGKVEDMYGRG